MAQVAAGDGGDDFDDAAHLVGEIGGHDVHVVGEIFPDAGHAGDLRLAAQFAFGTDFARDTRHFGRESVQLVHHGIDGIFEFENFTFYVHRDLAREVATRHGSGDFSHIADLGGQIGAHGVDRVGQVLPGAGHAGHDCLHTQAAFGAHFAGYAGHFGRKRAQLLDHGIDRFLELLDFTANIHGDFAGKVAVGDSDGDLGDVADLRGEIAGHRVHVVGQVLPGPSHTQHLGLSAELAFRAHFAGQAADF